jgi:formylglycine-generating enzyme required for sulfatase activity
MKNPFPGLVWFLPAAVALAALAAPAPPQIQNLVAAQRAGTMFVDITYDLVAPDNPSGVSIAVVASADGGTNYTIPGTALSGDAGLVLPGVGKKIVWDAWRDWANHYTPIAKVRLTADGFLVFTNALGTTNAGNYTTNVPPTSNLVWIPSGTFNMSGTLVYLSRSFWMGKYEVTQAEYQAVMGNNPSSFTGNPNRPVDQVTWFEAVQYCQTLTTNELAAGRLPAGWAYRLPTEAEWEYACRGGTTNTYYYGEDPNGTRLQYCAWYSVNAGGQTHDVGQKAPNRWGLYDMAGNVWEWCQDWSGNLPGGNVTDPQGPASGSTRVVRGGGWIHAADRCASSYRFSYGPTIRVNYYGFRIVLAPVQ